MDLTFELDLWGRLRRATEAARGAPGGGSLMSDATDSPWSGAKASSLRSRQVEAIEVITLVQAATKSWTNFACASALP
jgi:hypothetical protein